MLASMLNPDVGSAFFNNGRSQTSADIADTSGVIKVVVNASDSGEGVNSRVLLHNLNTDQRYWADHIPNPSFFGSPSEAKFFNLDTSHTYRIFVGDDNFYQHTNYLAQNYDGYNTPFDSLDEAEYTEVTFPAGENAFEVEVLRQPSAAIDIKFIDADTNQPISGFGVVNHIEAQQRFGESIHNLNTISVDFDGNAKANSHIYSQPLSLTVKTHSTYAPTTFVANPVLGVTTTVQIPLEKAGTITGRVTRNSNGTPIQNIGIELLGLIDPGYSEPYYDVLARGYSDENGNYEINNALEAGSYLIRTEDFRCIDFTENECYGAIYYGGGSDLDNATPVQVSNKVTTSNINFVLEPLPTISGAISVSSGEPLNEWVSVNFYTDPYTNSVKSKSVYLPEADYLAALDPGTYYVDVRPRYDSVYVGEFYNDKIQATADPIVLSAGDKLENINFQIDLGGVISGTVVDANTNEPLAFANVSILLDDYRPGDGFYQRTKDTRSDENGKFSFYGLPTGDYYINVNLYNSTYANNDSFNQYDDYQIIEGATPIAVTKEQTTFSTIGLKPYAKVSGIIKDAADQSPIINAGISVDSYYSIGYSDIDGTFEIEFDAEKIETEELFLYVAGPCEQNENTFENICKYIRLIEQVDVENGEVLSGLELFLDRKPMLTGLISDEETAEAVSGRVSVTDPTDRNFGKYVSCSIENDQCEYSLFLDPGTYLISAQAYNYLTEYYDNAADASSATLVQLDPNQEVSVDFELYKGDEINGVVTDIDTGETLKDITVRLFSTNQKGARSDYYAITGENGQFSFDLLRAGEYFLSFDSNTVYVDQFYGNVLDIEDAEPILLTKGSDVSVDMGLKKGGRLNLNLLDPDTSEKVPNPIGTLYHEDGTRYNGLAYPEIEANSVTINGIDEGSYYLLVGAAYHYEYLTEFYSATNTIQNAVSFTFSAGEVKDLTFDLRKSASISVTMSTENGVAPAGETIIDLNLYQIDDQCNCEKLAKTTQTYLNSGSSSFGYTIPYVNPDYTYVLVVNEREQNSFAPTRSEPFTIKAGEANPISIQLSEGFTISGEVKGSDTGDPINDVRVTFYEKTVVDGVETFSSIGNTTTDSAGQYSSKGLEDGTYFMTFETIYSQDQSSMFGPVESVAKHYVSEIYGDIYQVGDLETANPTPIVLNNSSQTIDVDLERGGKISGQIHSDFSYQSFDIEAYLKTDTGPVLIGQARRDYNRYTIPGLPAGEYLILFKGLSTNSSSDISIARKDVWYGGVQFADQATPVVLEAGGSVENINSPEPILGGTINVNLYKPAIGLVHDLDESVNGYLEVGLYNENGDLIYKTHKISIYDQYRFEGLWPGTYYVRFEDWKQTSLGFCNSVTFKGEWHQEAETFEQATAITITGSERIYLSGSLTPEFPTKEYQVSGRVVDEANNPIEGVTVTAEATRSPTISTITDANGEYTLTLPNGDYTITFEKDGYDFSGSSTDITVDDGGQSVPEVSAPEAPVTTPQPPAEEENTIYLPVITR